MPKTKIIIRSSKDAAEGKNNILPDAECVTELEEITVGILEDGGPNGGPSVAFCIESKPQQWHVYNMTRHDFEALAATFQGSISRFCPGSISTGMVATATMLLAEISQAMLHGECLPNSRNRICSKLSEWMPHLPVDVQQYIKDRGVVS